MTLRQSQATQAVLLEETQSQTHPLMELMDRHGMTILMVELALLAVFTFGAIATDQMGTNRQARAEAREKTVSTIPPVDVAPNAQRGANLS
jgi:hypothetical protein